MRNPAWNAKFPAQSAYTGGVAQAFLRRPDSMLHVKSAQNQPPFPGKGRQSRQHCRRIRAPGNRREKTGCPGPVSQGGKRFPLKKTKLVAHKIHRVLSQQEAVPKCQILNNRQNLADKQSLSDKPRVYAASVPLTAKTNTRTPKPKNRPLRFTSSLHAIQRKFDNTLYRGEESPNVNKLRE
jgi:hypothetical protein